MEQFIPSTPKNAKKNNITPRNQKKGLELGGSFESGPIVALPRVDTGSALGVGPTTKAGTGPATKAGIGPAGSPEGATNEDCTLGPAICCLMNTNVQIFVTYARGNLADSLSEKLFAYLQMYGYSGFLDRYSLVSGRDWKPQLERAMSTCHACVALIDEKYSNSTQDYGCIYEFRKMRQRNIPIIPILINGFRVPDDSPLMPHLKIHENSPQYIRWNVDHNDDAVLNHVVRDLCSEEYRIHPLCPQGFAFASQHAPKRRDVSLINI